VPALVSPPRPASSLETVWGEPLDDSTPHRPLRQLAPSGSSPSSVLDRLAVREEKRAAARSRGRGRPLVLIGVVVLLLIVGVVLFDAYYRSYSQYKQLKEVSSSLSVMIGQLSRGDAPSEGDLKAILSRVDRIRIMTEGGWFGTKFVASLPYLGRPVQAVRLGAAATQKESEALSIATGIVEDVLGNGPVGRSAVFADGVANTKLILSLPSRLEGLRAHIESGRSAIASIRSIPFVNVGELKARVLNASAQAVRSVQRAQSVIQLLPGFLGVGREKTYLLLLQDTARLRGTGGLISSYALISARDGKLSLDRVGEPTDLGVVDGTHPLPRAVAWYTRFAKETPTIDAVNFGPDFPVIAATSRSQYSKALGTPIDGVIAMDAAAVADALRATPSTPIKIRSFPRSITAHNVVRVAGLDVFRLHNAKRERVLIELVGAAFRTFTHSRNPFGTLQQLSLALASGHMKVWSADDQQAALFSRLGWDGSVDERPGDHLYLIQNNLLPNQLDYFSRQSMDCTVELSKADAARSTCLVEISNEVPQDQPLSIRGAGGVNRALLSLYIPQQSQLRAGSTPGNLQHREGRSRVLTGVVSAAPGKKASIRFSYTLTDVIQSRGDTKMYVLTIQQQPTIHPLEVTVRFSVPSGDHILAAPGWSINGSQATLHVFPSRTITTRVFIG
jgi:hypothetical protein